MVSAENLFRNIRLRNTESGCSVTASKLKAAKILPSVVDVSQYGSS